MKRVFSFANPILLGEVTNKKCKLIGFFKTYAEAKEHAEKLGLDSITAVIDNDITGRFFESGIYSENEIAICLANAYA